MQKIKEIEDEIAGGSGGDKIDGEDAEASITEAFRVERKVAGLRAIREAETDQTIAALRLMRSNYTEEQLQVPVLEFFKENLPGLNILTNQENGQIELKWSNEDINGDLIMENAEDMNHSILTRLSKGFPDLYSKQSITKP